MSKKLDLTEKRALFEKVFSSDEGQLVLNELYRMCFTDQPCLAIAKDSGDANVNMMLVKEGHRHVWFKIRDLLKEETVKGIHLI